MPRGRRLVPVSEDTIEELSIIARRTGMTLPELVESILSHALRVLRSRDDVASILASSTIMADIFRLGASPAPLGSLGGILETTNDNLFDKFVSESSSLARLVAASVRARGINPRDGLIGLVRAWFPSLALDVITNEDSNGRIVAASPLLSGSKLRQYVSSVLVSIVEGIGYRIVELKDEPGLVLILFSQK